MHSWKRRKVQSPNGRDQLNDQFFKETLHFRPEDNGWLLLSSEVRFTATTLGMCSWTDMFLMMASTPLFAPVSEAPLRRTLVLSCWAPTTPQLCTCTTTASDRHQKHFYIHTSTVMLHLQQRSKFSSCNTWKSEVKRSSHEFQSCIR